MVVLLLHIEAGARVGRLGEGVGIANDHRDVFVLRDDEPIGARSGALAGDAQDWRFLVQDPVGVEPVLLLAGLKRSISSSFTGHSATASIISWYIVSVIRLPRASSRCGAPASGRDFASGD